MTKLISSLACERNQQAILEVLSPRLKPHQTVLEVGSGTGQHAVYFARRLPTIRWLTSDVARQHPIINAWIEHANLSNVQVPQDLDVNQPWPHLSADVIYTANTLHILTWQAVKNLFAHIQAVLKPGQPFYCYGPFNLNGYTSLGNQRFDEELKQQEPTRGLREINALSALGQQHQLTLTERLDMPANNMFLVFERH